VGEAGDGDAFGRARARWVSAWHGGGAGAILGAVLEFVLALFPTPVDIAAFAVFVAVFPVYHAVYPWFAHRHPGRAARERVGHLRHSWIRRVLERGEQIVAIQATRNLTMVSSFLASSCLLLMGFTANIMMELRGAGGFDDPATVIARLAVLVLVLAVAFAYFVAGLRHLGHFNLTIGADPEVMRAEEGDPAILDRASGRYTLGVRALYSAFAIVLWCVDAWLLIAMCLFWAVRFVGFQDFGHVLRRR